ncbi:GNAT family N-acetyltransferase [Couchioplanes azureus]|uniref:GNAT family N-acetyltransferase n=1 Tax=Couchioplanes caeruleus TaxID=56438 RepID=UPI001670285C|nr:GNAT family N-acetyltransferase [Couchioplanes caeruleus]GGQ84789.1 hypothetical protein GCM10010166_63780 [Couchioplanes caeruleus subsp. azureus]
MTTVDHRTGPVGAGTDQSRREARRRELGELIDRDPATLTDGALLVDQLALDSLDMMTVLGWLGSHGVTLDAGRDRPVSVGDVLSLMDRTAFPGLSIQVADGPGPRRSGPAEVAVRPHSSEDPLAPVLSDPTFRLTPVEPDDIGFLFALATRPETCFRWRYRGAPPSLERFAGDLWKQVLVQYVARRAVDGEPVGHVISYGADPSMRYAYLGAAFQPRYVGTGLAANAVAVFARHLFHTFPLHKIYMEIPGFNWPQVRSGEGRLFQVEGVLRGHDYYAGRHWDQYVCAIYPDRPGAEAR